jgi:phosphatidylglycerophosphate synthase
VTAIAPVGDNSTLLWGLTAEERLRRIARAQELEVRSDGEVLVNLGYAFDPSWLKLAAAKPGLVVTRGGVPVLAHVGADREDIARAMAENGSLHALLLPGEGRGPAAPAEGLDPGLRRETLAWETSGDLKNEELRKKERPFMDRLAPETVRGLERASYFGAYKGVTDLLTKYLWPEWALVLTRWAARIGMSPNQVSLIGALLCLLATWLFYEGHYWPGLAAGLVFMVLDTVDGKLARCTITSSKIGEAIDHGIDLVHPPFWWWAWGVGLHAYGRPLAQDVFWWALAVIVGGYVVQRLIEGAFIVRFAMHIHVWRRFDSRFRLVTARRNPNMVILLAFLAVGRPDWGLVAVAAWTLASLAVHLIQLAQAIAARAAGRPVVSWLA